MKNEIERMQYLAGIKLDELGINRTKEDIISKLIEAGLFFDDGILGGLGSGSNGYYDSISDKISGYDLDEFNENEFNKWFDNFDIDSFACITYEIDDEEYEDINFDIIRQIKKGIYSVGKLNNGGGIAEIDKDKNLTLYSPPILTNNDGNTVLLPIFDINYNGMVISLINKNELISKLKQNITNPGSWYII